MRTIYTSFVMTVFSLLLLQPLMGQQVWEGERAASLVDGADVVRVIPRTDFPNYVHFQEVESVPDGDVVAFIKSKLDLPADYDLDLISTDHDNMGYMHLRFRQTYMGYEVEGSMYLAHYKVGEGIVSINGDLFDMSSVSAQGAINESIALQAALQHVNAQTYKWEIPSEEAHIHQHAHRLGTAETYYPAGELKLVPETGIHGNGEFKMAWEFDIYAHEPLSRTYTYVDAQTGMVLFQRDQIHTIDSVGTAVTTYSGNQTMTADFFSGGFRLRESGRGNGIETYNLLNGTDYGAAVDFLDNDNFWNNVNPQQDEVATDAHWGAEMTYDYFLSHYGRNSIDDAGFPLLSYVHYSSNFANAFWDGQRMTYGDGNGNIGALTALDITSHEITHGLTTFTSSLIYQNESGALNESFSDIFGVAVDFEARPLLANWLIGDDIGLIIRSMSNPNSQGDPDTYFGTNWFTGAGDNGGVHTNSGVQNYWFYLLTDGGSGTNDNGDAFVVNGLGIEDAGAIAFRNNTVYLTPSSQYADARFYALQSAADIFGGCSLEMLETANAWYAVGVGPEVISPETQANFRASVTELCSFPATVSFTNTTSFGADYWWDFGDGTNSSEFSPVHTYTTPGTYSVSLIATSDCGTDTLTESNLIVVNTPPDAPIGTGASNVCRSELTLNATSTGTVEWYNDAGQRLAVGNSFTTPTLNESTTFYAVNAEEGGVNFAPPQNSFFGGGGYHNNGSTQYLEFETTKDVVIQSAWVDANSTGIRNIQVWDGDGNLLQVLPININAGQGRITLDLALSAGEYRIGGTQMDLFRNNNGPNYPYEIEGVLSITGSSAGSNFYYYLYDWEVVEFCRSQGTPILAEILPLPDPTAEDAFLCEKGSVTLVGQGTEGSLQWLDAGMNFLADGDSYTTDQLSNTTTFFLQSAQVYPSLFHPPFDQNFGNGGFHNNNFPQYLEFNVLSSLSLESVEVVAGSAGSRDIILWDGDGNLLNVFSVNIDVGLQMVPLGISLSPGSYRLGGSNMDLFRHNEGPTYPYTTEGMLEITGSSAGPGFYYYFYKWELLTPPCTSDPVAVTVHIDTAFSPIADFSLAGTGSSYDFTNSSTDATEYLWDFGDGNSSTDENPSHTFSQKGTYTVSLTATRGGCTDVFTRIIEIRYVPSEFLIFEAELKNFNDALLTWRTVGGDDIVGYNIEYAFERGGVMGDFSNIHYQPRLGTPEVPQDYDHLVLNLAPGWHHFRLKQFDSENNESYSQVESLLITDEQPYVIVFPSPASDEAKVEVVLNSTNVYSIEIINNLGQSAGIIYEGTLDAGVHFYDIPVSRMANGLYYLRVSSDKDNWIQKFVVSHD